MDRCHHFGVKPKPEVGIQFGAGGTTEGVFGFTKSTRWRTNFLIPLFIQRAFSHRKEQEMLKSYWSKRANSWTWVRPSSSPIPWLPIQHLPHTGCEMIMIESEGITESVSTPRYNIISKIISELGTKHLMFEAADPEIFTHYIKTYGPEVNLFVDHSQILQLEGLRQGIWGVKDVWGRIVTYK